MEQTFAKEILNRATPLSGLGNLDRLIDHIKDKKVVMLGESSHGTSEFYDWRRIISMELIQNHGFNFIAVEGDWPSCQAVNSYVQEGKGRETLEVLKNFSRWPTWMWANTDVADLVEDLKSHNNFSHKKVGFHGLDVYSLFESIDEVIRRLKDVDRSLADKVGELYACFEPYRHNEKEYARSLIHYPEGCLEQSQKALTQILSTRMRRPHDGHAYFDALQNARIIQNAEAYYRSLVSVDDNSWNIRDQHMMETLQTLLKHYGPKSKGIVWEHNTHIGDYRATNMVQAGNVNIGGLAREILGPELVSLVGFTTYSGSVTASTAWDGPTLVMPVPQARPQSLEAELHEVAPWVGSPEYFVLLDEEAKKGVLGDVKGHRAIGVVYNPTHERWGNYVPTSLANRYDALVFMDKTKALTPYGVMYSDKKFPETYPDQFN